MMRMRETSRIKLSDHSLAQMNAPVFDRGETAEIVVNFDGSAELQGGPNGYGPGPGGYGGVVNINGQLYHVTGRIGDATKEVAEYLGLIGCIRGVIRTLKSLGWRHYYSSLICLGHSDVVIDQLRGDVKITNHRLRVLCGIVRSLEREFNLVTFSKIGRDENIESYKLAYVGRKAFSRPAMAVYHPNLKGFCDVWIEGVRTLGSNDIECSGRDPSFLIDSRFLLSLPGGRTLLRNMQDPYPLSVVKGKVSMTVLGTLQLHVGVRSFGTPLYSEPLCGPDTEGMVSFVVVEELPCPVHISWKNTTFPMNTQSSEMLGNVPFHQQELPELYHHHKYWHTDGKFIGLEL